MSILPTHFDFLSTQSTVEKLYHDAEAEPGGGGQ